MKSKNILEVFGGKKPTLPGMSGIIISVKEPGSIGAGVGRLSRSFAD